METEQKIVVPIRGMHCKSCEILIEEELKELPGVDKIKISHTKGQAEIYYHETRPDINAVGKAVAKAGYSVGPDHAKKYFISRNLSDYKDLGMGFLVLIILYYIVKITGLVNIDINATGDLTVPIVLLVGLAAGVSTCMALVGGLILGLSAKHNYLHPEATSRQKFKPHLFFNLGRFLSYALLGGLLGLVGSALQFSGPMLGLITIGVGLLMFVIGLQLVDIFPWLNNLKFTIPKSLGKVLGLGQREREYSHRGAMILGALTFFLPCGFTQAMQIYAVGTGTFFGGAIVMGTFALGTMPGLLGIGGLTSFVKGAFAHKFFKFAGLAVIAFAIFNISNGLGLAGYNLAIGKTVDTKLNDPNVTIENGIQIVKMAETSRGYEPNSFTIKKGVPVRWEIDAQAPYSCASSLMLPKYNIRKNLTAGQNIIEFTPTEIGRLPFSCSMGMYTGTFNVVDKNGQPSSNSGPANQLTAATPGTCGMSSGGNCSCGSKSSATDPSSGQNAGGVASCH